MRNYFPKRTSGATLYTLSKLCDVPVGFVSPSFEAVVAIFAVAKGWLLFDIDRMICLVLRMPLAWKLKCKSVVSFKKDITQPMLTMNAVYAVCHLTTITTFDFANALLH